MNTPSPTTTTTTNAVDVVTALSAELDLQSWPDPPRLWYSSSAPWANPGKRFHRVDWCPNVATSKNIQTYTETREAVGERVCHECAPAIGDLAELHARFELVRWLKRLGKVAAIVDSGQVPDMTELRSLRQMPSRILMPVAGSSARIAPAAEACAAAVSQLITLGSAQQVGAGVREDLLCAARLLLPAQPPAGSGSYTPTEQSPRTSRDIDLIGRATLSKPWAAFFSTLEKEEDLPAAAAAALKVGIPTKPWSLTQVTHVTVTAAREGQVIGLPDVVKAWRAQAETLTRAHVSDWVDGVRSNAHLSAQLGTLSVVMPAMDASFRSDMVALSGVYPMQVLTNGTVLLRAPAAVALHLARDQKGTLVADEDTPEQVIVLAKRLMKEHVQPLEAFASARAIHAAAQNLPLAA